MPISPKVLAHIGMTETEFLEKGLAAARLVIPDRAVESFPDGSVRLEEHILRKELLPNGRYKIHHGAPDLKIEELPLFCFAKSPRTWWATTFTKPIFYRLTKIVMDIAPEPFRDAREAAREKLTSYLNPDPSTGLWRASDPNWETVLPQLIEDRSTFRNTVGYLAHQLYFRLRAGSRNPDDVRLVRTVFWNMLDQEVVSHTRWLYADQMPCTAAHYNEVAVRFDEIAIERRRSRNFGRIRLRNEKRQRSKPILNGFLKSEQSLLRRTLDRLPPNSIRPVLDNFQDGEPETELLLLICQYVDETGHVPPSTLIEYLLQRGIRVVDFSAAYYTEALRGSKKLRPRKHIAELERQHDELTALPREFRISLLRTLPPEASCCPNVFDEHVNHVTDLIELARPAPQF